MSLDALARSITGAAQRRVVPALQYSQTHFENVLAERVRGTGAWLDLGCGHRLLPEWRADAERALLAAVPLIVGIDYELDALRKHRSIRYLARADARSLPFADGTFDLVTANMVVEHLDDPATQFSEIARVLRPGGCFLFHTPNSRSYVAGISRLLPDVVKRWLAKALEGRDAADVFPTYYRVNRQEDIGLVARRTGLSVAELRMVSTNPVLSNFPPVGIAELVVLRFLERPSLARFRSNIICALEKPAAP